ncbi:MAG: AAA family ATPase [Magnetococcales bacterium]|nr:AAA family ATPase [Magnetococcales bacterium]
MRIDELHLKNFKCFEDRRFGPFDPQFNLVIGDNGTGKTSFFQAMEVVLSEWLRADVYGSLDRTLDQWEKGQKLRTFDLEKVRQIESPGAVFQLEFCHPAFLTVNATIGELSANSHIELSQDEHSAPLYRLSVSPETDNIRKLALGIFTRVRAWQDEILPLVASYDEYRASSTTPVIIASTDLGGLPSRFDGYREAQGSSLSGERLTTWFANKYWIAWGEDKVPFDLPVVREAIRQFLPGAEKIDFDRVRKEIVATIQGKTLPFSLLSRGQRDMMALVGDLAQRAVSLNPHLENPLQETPGVVLIDELDLHLHPKWQRNIVHDLKRVFPKLQFFCTTHSPVLIGEVKPEEIVFLEEPASRRTFGMDANAILNHVMGGTERNAEVKRDLDAIFDWIEAGEFESAKKAITDLRNRIGDIPDLVAAEVALFDYQNSDGREEG